LNWLEVRFVRGVERVQRRRRRNRLARVLAVALVTGAAMTASGCASIGSLFDTPEQAEPKMPVRKPAPVKAATVTPEQRAEASALHATALDQMGRGAIGPATSNLALAAKLDPTNAQIRRDLATANRMRSAVSASDVPLRRGSVD
jgi:hypothetical protein